MIWHRCQQQLPALLSLHARSLSSSYASPAYHAANHPALTSNVCLPGACPTPCLPCACPVLPPDVRILLQLGICMPQPSDWLQMGIVNLDAQDQDNAAPPGFAKSPLSDTAVHTAPGCFQPPYQAAAAAGASTGCWLCWGRCLATHFSGELVGAAVVQTKDGSAKHTITPYLT
jgi:hypothetical protein